MHNTRYARYGMVCSVDHLASAAGVNALERGGSAADAAIATNAVLAVTAPHLCGMGGDLFALVHADGEVTALDASGRAGSGADAAQLRSEGHERMPHLKDIRSVTVPGCVDGWLALHDRYGRLPLEQLLAPAIRLAESGFPASPLMAPGAPLMAEQPGGTDYAPVRAAGDLMTRPGVARALLSIVEDGRDGFYLGEFGGGLLELGAGEYTSEDLAKATGEWVRPLSVEAFGHRIWSMPPVSQGYLLLLSLGIVDGLDLPDSPEHPAFAHLLAEASRAAGHDRLALLHENATGLVSPEEIARRRALVDPAARSRLAAPTADGDTTYLCAVDGEGMGVSLIQSNASGFGSLLIEPNTGINLHNRGIGFSLEPGHPAEYAPGRRPPHTLAPALITRPDGSLRSVVGTMGGDAQPQILLQVITSLLKYGRQPGQALAAPRWRLGSTTGFDTWTDPDAIVLQLEEGAPWAGGLEPLGHPVAAVPYGSSFGHAHLIDVQDNGVLAGAADPRSLIGAALGI
ncbi:MAG: gamma-glutamyltranspeptidase [Thermoactinospora sp.]|nr:gamma-glutamyltranspeptidase [Thermoactinospora sp.]